jgi:hypothetical protein
LDRLTNDELEQLERLLAVAAGAGGAGEGRKETSVVEHDEFRDAEEDGV